MFWGKKTRRFPHDITRRGVHLHIENDRLLSKIKIFGYDALFDMFMISRNQAKEIDVFNVLIGLQAKGYLQYWGIRKNRALFVNEVNGSGALVQYIKNIQSFSIRNISSREVDDFILGEYHDRR